MRAAAATFPGARALGRAACLAVLPVVAHASGHDAAELLERMGAAARTLNYDGTFVYRKGEVFESMRIIHQVDGAGRTRERLVSLNGAAREVLRDDTMVRCILPDDGAIVVAKARDSAIPSPAVALSQAVSSEHYRLSMASAERVAGRATRSVTIEPVDEYRYGYRLWLDRETGLLLRSVVLGTQGAELEEIVYTSISLPESIPDEELEPETEASRFVVKDLRKPPPGAAKAGARAWAVDDPPPGFMVDDAAARDATAPSTALGHLVVTDGIASASVFVEPLGEPGERLEGISRMGPVSAYGRVAGDLQITVVGEVPPATVRRIGDGVRAR